MIKNYTFNLNVDSIWLTVFLLVPTVVWSLFPAPNDVLRTESVSPIFDLAASIGQVIFIGLLCFTANAAAPKHNVKSTLMISTILSCSVYYLSWIVYYIGMVNFALILILTLAPCAAFLYLGEKKSHRTFSDRYFYALPLDICHNQLFIDANQKTTFAFAAKVAFYLFFFFLNSAFQLRGIRRWVV